MSTRQEQQAEARNFLRAEFFLLVTNPKPAPLDAARLADVTKELGWDDRFLTIAGEFLNGAATRRRRPFRDKCRIVGTHCQLYGEDEGTRPEPEALCAACWRRTLRQMPAVFERKGLLAGDRHDA